VAVPDPAGPPAGGLAAGGPLAGGLAGAWPRLAFVPAPEPAPDQPAEFFAHPAEEFPLPPPDLSFCGSCSGGADRLAPLPDSGHCR
jgi:hypothetical protein